jgi:hypothetical protein
MPADRFIPAGDVAEPIQTFEARAVAEMEACDRIGVFPFAL